MKYLDKKIEIRIKEEDQILITGDLNEYIYSQRVTRFSTFWASYKKYSINMVQKDQPPPDTIGKIKE